MDDDENDNEDDDDDDVYDDVVLKVPSGTPMVPPAIVHGVLIFGIVQFAESQAEERRAREP